MLIADQSLLPGNEPGLLWKHLQCWETKNFQVLEEILKNIMDNLAVNWAKAKLDPSRPAESQAQNIYIQLLLRPSCP